MNENSAGSPRELVQILQRDLEAYMELKRVEVTARRKIINLYHLGAEVELGDWTLNLPFDDIDQERPFIVPMGTTGGTGAQIQSLEAEPIEPEIREAGAQDERAFYSFRAMRLAIDDEDLEWIWNHDRVNSEMLNRLKDARAAQFDKFRARLAKFAWTVWEDQVDAMRRSREWGRYPQIWGQYVRVRWALSRMALFAFALNLGFDPNFPDRPVSALMAFANGRVSA